MRIKQRMVCICRKIVRYQKRGGNMKSLNIPVGVSDFTEIRQNGYYYIDKSGLIKDILETTSTKVTLITRQGVLEKLLL